MRSEIARRLFLKQAGCSLLALPTAVIARGNFHRFAEASDADALHVQHQLLDLVNEERTEEGLSVLKLDALACAVAEKHAIEMAENGFLSHWGRDGRKPYHRYSFAGGTEATEENEGAADHGVPAPPDVAMADLISLHLSMYNEVAPNDGHRRTILGPQHTHVGFGSGWHGLHVRLSEIYVARYVTIDPYPAIQKPGSKFTFSGKVLNPEYTLTNIDVFYEPLPSPPDLSWLQTARPYSLPDARETLLPKLPENTYYTDNSKGSISLHRHGKFRVPINLTRKPAGIYTIVVWLQKGKLGTAFPATQACVRTE